MGHPLCWYLHFLASVSLSFSVFFLLSLLQMFSFLGLSSLSIHFFSFFSQDITLEVVHQLPPSYLSSNSFQILSPQFILSRTPSPPRLGSFVNKWQDFLLNSELFWASLVYRQDIWKKEEGLSHTLLGPKKMNHQMKPEWNQWAGDSTLLSGILTPLTTWMGPVAPKPPPFQPHSRNPNA